MSGTERLDFISSRQAKMLTDTEIPLVPLILISRKVFFELASAGLSFLLQSGPNPKVGSPKSAKLEWEERSEGGERARLASFNLIFIHKNRVH